MSWHWLCHQLSFDFARNRKNFRAGGGISEARLTFYRNTKYWILNVCVLIYFISASMSIESADFEGDILACLTRNLFVWLSSWLSPCTNGRWGLANGNGNGKTANGYEYWQRKFANCLPYITYDGRERWAGKGEGGEVSYEKPLGQIKYEHKFPQITAKCYQKASYDGW